MTDGSLRGTTLALGQAPILIGRAPECTLVLEDDYASGRHARFFLQQGVWYLEDLGSTNGTYVGDRKITRAKLENRGEFEIGSTTLMLIRSALETPSGG